MLMYKKIAIISGLLISGVFSVSAQSADEPGEMTSLRASWTRAREQATKPIDDKYVAALTALQLRFTKAGNLDAALQVNHELKQVATPTQGTWIVLFSSNNPKNWSAKAVSKKAPVSTKYLRIKRLDNGEAVIIEVTKDNLCTQTTLNENYCWYGVNDSARGANHLGIGDFDKNLTKGSIVINHNTTNERSGWGFGHVAFVDTDQGYAWAGQAISKTSFEIAVSDAELTNAEKAVLLK